MQIRPSNARYIPAPVTAETDDFSTDPTPRATAAELSRTVEIDASGRAWTRVVLAPVMPA